MEGKGHVCLVLMGKRSYNQLRNALEDIVSMISSKPSKMPTIANKQRLPNVLFCSICMYNPLANNVQETLDHTVAGNTDRTSTASRVYSKERLKKVAHKTSVLYQEDI